MHKLFHPLVLTFFLGLPALLPGQTSYLAQAQAHLLRQSPQLNPADLEEMAVISQYESQHNGVTHVYWQQRHQGIDIYNAIAGFHFKNGQIVFATERLEAQLTSRAPAAAPRLTALAAVEKVAQAIDLPLPKSRVLTPDPTAKSFTINWPELSPAPIPTQLVFWPTPEGTLALAWKVALEDGRNADHWSILVDAQTGEVLKQNNYTLYCQFDRDHHHHSWACWQEEGATPLTPVPAAPPAALNSNLYHVYPFPTESPLHGSREVLVDPADPIASPFGWHDTNGVPGPEFLTTRGNNTHAYLDTDRDNSPDTIALVNGGTNLVFDFPHSLQFEPQAYRQAAVTQLFYANNFLHDFTYRYGFDENAGNFQQNNYGKGGTDRDPVMAEAQDGSGLNNANFGTPPDGASPRMQMFLWTSTRARLLRVTSPSNLAGNYPASTASFGPLVQDFKVPLEGNLVVALDASANPTQGCQTLLNPESIRGKIAVIARGNCFFYEKVANAQAAGAIGVIITNTDTSLLSMGGEPTTPIDIPAIMVNLTSGNLLRNALAANQTVGVSIRLPGLDGTGEPYFADASFDNGIIAHEYGHGISNRLTGGPANTDCLFNDEQMGEGWSDFFALVTTVKPGANGKLPRNIAGFSSRSGVNGRGLRRQYYSTDPQVNTQVYHDVLATTAPHPLGEVWAATLWDLYWALSDRYGWDPDILDGKGGNNLAIQLVMDGMKLQSCSPGFIDGRDAILAADAINNDGANECLIWEVFARRGLGWSADQRSASSRNDGKQAFDNRPECIPTLKVEKLANPLINAGDSIRYEIRVVNHKSTPLNQVIINDELATSVGFNSRSVKGATKITQNGNMLSMEIGTLAPGEQKVISYQVASSPANRSIRQFFDGAENGITNWTVQSQAGTRRWDTTQVAPFAGRYVWTVANSTQANDQALTLRNPLTLVGKLPTLRFFHQYNIEPGYDGGVVEISTNNGLSWQILPTSAFLREAYRGPIFYGTNVEGFSGVNNYAASYVDLSAFAGRSILLRFRFRSNTDTGARPTVRAGWSVDNIEIFDRFVYNTSVCAKSAEGDQACAVVPEAGTIVEPSSVTTSTTDPTERYRIAIYPNPTQAAIQVAIDGWDGQAATLAITSLDGRILTQQQLAKGTASTQVFFDLGAYPAGLYLLRVATAQKVEVHKVVKAE